MSRSSALTEPRYAVIVMLALASLPGAQAASARDAAEPALEAMAIQIDNDLFAGTERDLDYTGGLAIAWSGLRARDAWLSLDPWLRAIDSRLQANEQSGQGLDAAVAPPTLRHARQLGLMAFTPENISARGPLPADRPYASLLFLSNGRTLVSADGLSARTSSLTLGVLGLPVVADLHEAIHAVTGSPAPRGYAHQISAGGEPTFRYSLARQQLVIADPSGLLEVKTTVEGSVGYLTEASAAISLRFGRTTSPWWGFTPELDSYLSSSAPFRAAARSNNETFLFAGARFRARAYDVFLQGQFRQSEVTITSDDVARLVGDLWLGLAIQLAEGTRLTYAVRYQTAEITHGPAARELVWATMQLTHAF